MSATKSFWTGTGAVFSFELVPENEEAESGHSDRSLPGYVLQHKGSSLS